MDSKYIAGVTEIARFDFSRLKNGLDKTSNGINKAAQYLWNIGQGDHGTQEVPILFTDLTKKQKLDLVAAHLEQVIMDMVRTQLSVEGQDTARAAAQADADLNY